MKYIAGIFLVLLCSSIALAQTVSVKSHTAELRDSNDPYTYQVMLMLPRYYPLDVEDEDGDLLKVTDFLGRTGWVAKTDIADAESVVIRADGSRVVTSTRTVVVKTRNINIRSGPGTDHSVVLRANQGVAFKVLESQKDWLHVQHESGSKGWLHRNLVWGYPD